KPTDDPDNGVPGPGAYSYVEADKYRQKNPQYSLGKSEREEGSEFYAQSTDAVRSAFPGPGHYQVDGGYTKILPRTPNVPVTKVPKDVDYNNKVPGPGAYENDSIKIKQNNPKWSVGKTNRDDPILSQKERKELENEPGPGNYNLSSSIGDGRKVFIKINYF
ncbi:MAG: hypothetical protein ACKO96_02365, partial [Flammeovirgaceae bacterium]